MLFRSDFITEKFALFNLLKALNSLSPQNTDANPPAVKEEPPAPVFIAETPNVMASVLERHERIANRVRNKK